MMESMIYFGKMVLEILENNQLKSYFGNSNRDFVPTFGNFVKENISLLNFLELCSNIRVAGKQNVGK